MKTIFRDITVFIRITINRKRFGSDNICNTCGRVLSYVDKIWYGYTCEKCERRFIEIMKDK